jgi:hypothetical protein
MSQKNKKAAPEKTETEPAEPQQHTTMPDASSDGIAPVAAEEDAVNPEPHSIALTDATPELLQTSTMSPEENQYLAAIGMKDAELGAIIKTPTERINKWYGSAIAHENKAKEERRLAQKEFNANLAYYYEAKQRLLNPKYRPDLSTGQERTEEDNLKNFGAKDWQQFNANCRAYSLQHANAKLKEFAKLQGLPADDSDCIETEEIEGEYQAVSARRKVDLTAQKRYEHIATAAMAIANANPDEAISKQILAAAEVQPAPLMPLPPDVYTELLTFITKVAKSADTGEMGEIKAEARRLIGKMLAHRPKPDPEEVLAEAQEELRKRDKRPRNNNSEASGAATSKALLETTSESSLEEQSATAQPDNKNVSAATPKRFWWTERKMGDMTELVVMDGKKVYDCRPMEDLPEIPALIEKLNAEAAATAMAAD